MEHNEQHNEQHNETWRAVNGFPRYEVSDAGRVRNIVTGNVFTGTKDAFGYVHVRLMDPYKKYKLRKMHRLVAEAFVPNPDGKPVVDHIDGDKSNNSADNLRWVTYSENVAAWLTKNPSEMRAERAVKRRVAQYDGDGALVAVHRSPSAAEEATGVKAFSLYQAAKGALKTAGGFQWRFVERGTEPEAEIGRREDARLKKVRCIGSGGEKMTFDSMAEAAEYVMEKDKLVTRRKESVYMNILHNLRGQTNEAYGYRWRYA